MQQSLVVLAVTVWVGLVASTMAQGPDVPIVWSGVFSEAQAERGGAAFGGAAACSSCHGFDGALDGNRDMFPPLAGEAFVTAMTGRAVAYLQRYIRENKPAGSPGSLGEEAALDLTAYILSRNGFPAGGATLTQESAARALIGPQGWDGVLPDAAVVRVVGCLAEGEDGDWVVARAGAPARIAGDGIEPGAADLPLGAGAYPLRFVLAPLDELAGHRVWVRGALVGDGGADGINVSLVESVAEACD